MFTLCVKNKRAADRVLRTQGIYSKEVTMSPNLEVLLSSSFKLRKTLEQVLQKEAVDYILSLIAKDNAHRKLLKIIEET